ncbi:MAG: hypothetical protein EOP51_09895 [Sphingobacteriales bacterium]|nr:MAG: hypothetical protein EOP51_09895 [Sphingobacteriales bacterium]
MPRKLVSALLALLSIATGIVFLYSAYTKAATIESFETFQFTIAEYLHFPWVLSAVFAAFMIGVEAALGALLIFNLYGARKWVLKGAIAMLVAFSIYLVYLWAKMGNDINCGCFGDAIWMSPSASLIKNLLLAIAIGLLMLFHRGLMFKRSTLVIWAIAAIVIAVPYIIYPLPDTEPEWINKDRHQIDLTSLYAPGKTDAPTVDLTKGKHVIAFMSLSCPHCRVAAYKMHVMKERNPSLPFHLVLAGKEKYWKPFFDQTKATNIPNTRLDADTFTGLVGYSWPVIYLLNDGWIEAQTNYVQMDQNQIENWLKASK